MDDVSLTLTFSSWMIPAGLSLAAVLLFLRRLPSGFVQERKAAWTLLFRYAYVSNAVLLFWLVWALWR